MKAYKDSLGACVGNEGAETPVPPKQETFEKSLESGRANFQEVFLFGKSTFTLIKNCKTLNEVFELAILKYKEKLEKNMSREDAAKKVEDIESEIFKGTSSDRSEVKEYTTPF